MKPVITIIVPESTTPARIAEFTEHCQRTGMTEEFWLLGFHGKVDVPQIQVFYEKDFNRVKYDELKKIIEDSVKSKA